MILNNIKRCFCVLLIVCICMCSVVIPVGAEAKLDTAQTEMFIEQLSDLGILEYDITREMYELPVTRAQAYGVLIGMLGGIEKSAAFDNYEYSDISELPEADKIQLAYEFGYIKSDWKFNPESAVKVGDVMIALISEMGYNEIASELGKGYGGYMIMANRLGLTSGISVSSGDELTWETFVTLIHNSLDKKVMYTYGYDSNGRKKEAVVGLTMLNVYFDIYKITGIVTANKITSLSSDIGVGEGRVLVGKQSVFVGETEISDYLGYNVECYAELKDGKYTAVSAQIDVTSNNICVIEAEDLLTNDAKWSSVNIVYADDKGRRKEETISTDVSVIYNGKYYFDYTAADLAIALGNITVIDNTNDGNADVVLINEYKNYVVDTYVSSDETLYYKTGDGNSGNSLSLSAGLDIDIKNALGEEYNFAELTEYTVISAIVSKDKTYVSGVVVKDRAIGQVTNIKDKDGKTEFTMDSGSYTISPAYTDANGNVIKPSLGKRYVAYLDKNGYVAYLLEKSSGFSYGFLYEASLERGFSTEITFRLFTDSGAWEDLRLADKVYLNGTEKKESDLAGLQELFVNGKVKQQIIKTSVNSDNEINKIYTAVDKNTTTDKEALTSVKDGTSRTYKSPHNGFSDFSYSLSGTIIFVLPKIGSGNSAQYVQDRELYSIASTSDLIHDNAYTFAEFYDVSDTKQVSIAEVNKSLSGSNYWNNYAVFVNDVVTSMDENGDTYDSLLCLNKGKEVEYSSLKEEYINGVNKGDILVIHLNKKGLIDAPVSKVWDGALNQIAPLDEGEKLTVGNGRKHLVWYDTVKIKDDSNILLNNFNKCIPLSAPKYVTVRKKDVASGQNIYRSGSAAEVHRDSDVLIYVRSGECYDMVIFE